MLVIKGRRFGFLCSLLIGRLRRAAAFGSSLHLVHGFTACSPRGRREATERSDTRMRGLTKYGLDAVPVPPS
jgi:hypothetical protein